MTNNRDFDSATIKGGYETSPLICNTNKELCSDGHTNPDVCGSGDCNNTQDCGTGGSGDPGTTDWKTAF